MPNQQPHELAGVGVAAELVEYADIAALIHTR